MFSYHKYPHLMLGFSIFMFLIALSLLNFNQSLMMEWTLAMINSSVISYPILMDPMSTLFMFTVSFISFNVLTFSKVYMMNDNDLHRFTHLVMSFIVSMMLLILSPNVISMLLGWDGLGITSFLLVIYYQNNRSLKSGFITLISNRIGDCFILMSITLIMSQGHWNMLFMWKDVNPLPNMLTIMILAAALTKSAQFPFMAWLTCAMAAPTPVSALVHSSTLVTAGVYLLIRMYPFLSELIYFNAILASSGAITMAVSSGWAMTKKDMKETIALSTMSQIGLMMTSLGLGNVHLAFFHLLTHAMFKANMFMVAGMVIFFKGHKQNFANMRMKKNSRTLGISMSASLLSMNAMFFFAGYYSKDMILESAIWSPLLFIIMLLFMFSTALTATYSTRIYRGTVTTKPTRRSFFRKNFPNNIVKIHIMNNKNFKIMEVPMVFMTLASLIMGSMLFNLTLFPADTMVVPRWSEFLWPFLTCWGAFIAAFFCPSNKAKQVEKTAYKWINKTKIKMYKFNYKFGNVEAEVLEVSLWLKTKQFLYKKLGENKWYSMRKKKQKHTKNIKKNGSKKQKTRPVNIFVYMNFKLAEPMLKLSFMLEKYLDTGIYKVMGPNIPPSISSSASNFFLNLQNMKLNALLTMLLLSMIILAPFMLS